MPITKVDVLSRFAEFGTILDPEWNAVIADAVLQVDPSTWTVQADLATIYMTAHLLGMAHPNLIPNGRVIQRSMDKVSYRYAVADHQAAVDDLDSTPYGRLFKGLRRQLSTAQVL